MAAQFQEHYVTFDPKAYDRLFDEELEKVIARTSDPAHRQIPRKDERIRLGVGGTAR